MSDKRISDLTPAAALSPDAIVPVAQVDPTDGILKTFGVSADKFSHGTYAFPNDPTLPVTASDIGKLAMNDGSGTAKLYQLSPAVPSVPGSWTIRLDAANWVLLSSNSSVTIDKPDGTIYTSDQGDWRAGSIPATAADELVMIKAKIDSHGLNLITGISATGDLLTIQENGYQGYRCKVNNIPSGIFTVVQLALPVCQQAPTAFPLGKIVGLKGSDVLISSSYVETYPAAASLITNNSDFNVTKYNSLDFSNPATMTDLLKLVAVPAANGTVTAYDLSSYNLDNSFPYAQRHQLVGLILRADSSTVTVMHINPASLVVNGFLKMLWRSNNS
jgi:hypothetical protein